MKPKLLQGKGEADYDYQYDILFFKTSEREYLKSIELDNIVIDIDKEGFIVGIQILEASEFLNIGKDALRKTQKWFFMAKFENGKVEIRLTFQVIIRNKIVEKNPIIIESINQKLPNSQVECEVPFKSYSKHKSA